MMTYEDILAAHAARAERIAELDRLNTQLHELVYSKHGIALSISNDEVFIDGFGLMPIGGVARIAELSAALATAEAALGDIGDADREPGDDVAWCESRAAEALPAVRAVMDRPSRLVQQPGAVTARDLSARDATSVSDMCALLDKHFIKRYEYTDCTILYSVTFEQLRNLYDDGRTLRSQPTQKGPAQ